MDYLYIVCRKPGCKMNGLAQEPNGKCRECGNEDVERKEAYQKTS